MFLPPTIELKKKFILTILPTLLLLPTFTQAESVNTEEWQITADKISRYEDPKSIVAEGNIVLTKLAKMPPKPIRKKSVESDWSSLLEEEVTTKEVTGEEITKDTKPRYKTKVTIKADWMAYDVDLESIRARGNIYIKMGGDQLYAQKGTVNLKHMTGKFHKATVLRDEKDLHLEGDYIEKTGLKTYRVNDGWVITCKVERGKTPPWRLAASETDVSKGGYAHLKHARFYVGQIPIFYTPYMVLPAKNTRQTGLIFPEFSYSTNSGAGISVPFFLNISNSADMTFYPELLAKRGLMAGLEFRYVNSANNKGMFIASQLYDNLTDPSETEYYADTKYTHTNKDRYWLRGKIDHTFPNDFIARLDLDIVSDLDYLDEFNSGITGHKETNSRFINVFGRGFANRTDAKRINSLKTLKTWGNISLEAGFLAINDVSDTEKTTTTTNDDGSTTTVINPSPLWQLPSIELGGVHSFDDTSLSFTWDVDYVNFWREEGVGGHRLDIYPRLSMPIPLGSYLESRAEAGIRETFYMIETNGDTVWAKSDTADRLLFDFDFEVGTTLLRDYKINDGKYDLWSHQIRPFIEYGFISDVDQKDMPRFNSVDQIASRNNITYGFKNYFDLAGTKKDKDYTKRLAMLNLQQSYDLRSESSDEPFGPIELELELSPWSNTHLEFQTKLDVYDSDFIYHRLATKYRNSRGDFLLLDYTYHYNGDKETKQLNGKITSPQDTEQLNAQISLKLLASLTGQYAVKYSIVDDQINEQNVALTYQAACWSMTLKSVYTPDDTSFLVLFELLNIGSPLRVSL